MYAVRDDAEAYEIVCPAPVDGSTPEVRQEWLRHRLTGIGASDVPAILGLDKYRGPLDVWAEKTGALKDEDHDSEAAFWGRRLEKDVIEVTAQRRGMDFQRGEHLLRSRRWPWMLATPDAYLGTRCIPLQAKTVSLRFEKEWAEGAPAKHIVQNTAEMLVYGTEDEGCVSGLIGGQQLVWDPVKYDAQLAAQIVAATGAMWDLIQAKTPPNGFSARLDSVKAVWPSASEGLIINLPPTADALVMEWLQAKEQETEGKKEAKRLEAEIRALMKDAEFGRLHGGGILSLKLTTQHVAAQPARTSEFRTLRYKAEK